MRSLPYPGLRSWIVPMAAGAIVVAFFSVVTGCDPRTFDDGFEDFEGRHEVWQFDAHESCGMDAVADNVRSGSLSLRIRAPEGLRCELVPKVYPSLQAKYRREPFGRTRWYNFSVYVEDLGNSPEPRDYGDNTIVAQWHSSPDPFFADEGGRGPPLALRIYNDTWGITYGWERDLRSTSRYLANNWHWVGPVQTGRWIDWSFRVTWSYDNDGVTEVWRDGELVMERTGPNAFNDFRGVYLKLGLYHPTSDQTILLDRVSIENQQDSF